MLRIKPKKNPMSFSWVLCVDLCKRNLYNRLNRNIFPVGKLQDAVVIVLLQVNNLIVLRVDNRSGIVVGINKYNISLHAIAESNSVVEIRVGHVLKKGKDIFHVIFLNSIILKVLNDCKRTHRGVIYSLACHGIKDIGNGNNLGCLLYKYPSPRDVEEWPIAG